VESPPQALSSGGNGYPEELNSIVETADMHAGQILEALKGYGASSVKVLCYSSHESECIYKARALLALISLDFLLLPISLFCPTVSAIIRIDSKVEFASHVAIMEWLIFVYMTIKKWRNVCE